MNQNMLWKDWHVTNRIDFTVEPPCMERHRGWLSRNLKYRKCFIARQCSALPRRWVAKRRGTSLRVRMHQVKFLLSVRPNRNPGYFGVGYDELKIMAFKTDKIIAIIEPLVTYNTYWSPHDIVVMYRYVTNILSSPSHCSHLFKR